jgi:uncharacterized protein DUF6627
MRRFSKLVSQLLIVCMAWTPFSIQASLVGTDQVVASAQDQTNRDKVVNFVQRTDVAKQFELLGVSSANAAERVNAMTQDEINQLAGKIDSLPAAGMDTVGWVLVAAVVGVIIWYMWYRR